MIDVPPPDAPPGWYRDPDQAETQRYWDGEEWTDQRAPLAERSSASWTDSSGGLTESGRFAVGLILAGLGAVIAIIGVFLPLADTESNLHIAKNSMIQHPDGVVVIGVALAGALAAIGRATRPLTFLAGCALIGAAILVGNELPIEYRNRFSEIVAGDASPGAGVWTVGVGGALLLISALFADWKTLFSPGGRAGSEPRDSSSEEGDRQTSRWDEIMGGRRQEEPDSAFADEETGQEPGPPRAGWSTPDSES
jgi:uncharacterized protein DUF2510